jgi:hypothetical protein
MEIYIAHFSTQHAKNSEQISLATSSFQSKIL